MSGERPASSQAVSDVGVDCRVRSGGRGDLSWCGRRAKAGAGLREGRVVAAREASVCRAAPCWNILLPPSHRRHVLARCRDWCWLRARQVCCGEGMSERALKATGPRA